MTRKEMDKYFSKTIYDSMRGYVEQVLDAHPEITDELVVEFAAGKMEECADDGVDISVEDALRLTAKHAPIPTAEDFKKALSGINTVGDFLSLIAESVAKSEKPTDSLPMSVISRAARMTDIGRRISSGNKDIVLMGVPADLTYSFAQVKLAFFTENLTEDEQKMIEELKVLSDSVKYTEQYGIGYAMFRIELT